MNYTPENITSLEPNEIFVFGSNEAGIHGAGAAKDALLKFGAIQGRGYGLQGQSFGIPTKDKRLNTLSLTEIECYVRNFVLIALVMVKYKFLVTKIGCGYAGYKPSDIAPMFIRLQNKDNVTLPKEFYITLP